MSEHAADPGGMLSERERALLLRQLGRKQLSLAFSLLSLAVAVGVVVESILTSNFASLRIVLVMLILIGSKNHLRIYRLTSILDKVTRGSELRVEHSMRT